MVNPVYYPVFMVQEIGDINSLWLFILAVLTLAILWGLVLWLTLYR